MGVARAGEIQAPVQNPDGTYQWWVKNDAGQLKLHPKFALSLTAPNTDPKTGWTQDFIKYCQDPNHMDVGKDFLLTVPGETFIQVLEGQLWQYLWGLWKDIQSGKQEGKVAQDLARGRENARNEIVSRISVLKDVQLLTTFIEGHFACESMRGDICWWGQV